MGVYLFHSVHFQSCAFVNDLTCVILLVAVWNQLAMRRSGWQPFLLSCTCDPSRCLSPVLQLPEWTGTIFPPKSFIPRCCWWWSCSQLGPSCKCQNWQIASLSLGVQDVSKKLWPSRNSYRMNMRKTLWNFLTILFQYEGIYKCTFFIHFTWLSILQNVNSKSYSCYHCIHLYTFLYWWLLWAQASGKINFLHMKKQMMEWSIYSMWSCCWCCWSKANSNRSVDGKCVGQMYCHVMFCWDV